MKTKNNIESEENISRDSFDSHQKKSVNLHSSGSPKKETLKDIENLGMLRENIKAEAINWIKEDIGEFNIDLNYERKGVDVLNRKWMKRLNITSEDLK